MSDPVSLSKFDKEMSWAERSDLIHKTFPSINNINWVEVFQTDPQVLGRLVNDILKLDGATPGKPGKRPNIAPEQASERLAQMTGEDFSMLKFPEAFKILKADRSVRHLARLCSMNHSEAHRLLMGVKEPNVEIMRIVAQAFNKQPSYFLEYRIAFVVSYMCEIMMDVPETSAVQYMKLRK